MSIEANAYIEVTGTASFEEEAVEYGADITLTARAAQPETALREAVELRSACIRRLSESGLSEQELQEGGAELHRPWFWRKKPGQEAAQKIIVRCREIQRLYGALGSLESLFENQRHTISVSMLRPRFEASEEARARAQRAAIANARAKALIIAEEARLQISAILQVEESGIRSAGSGMFGDEEWRGYAVAAGGGAPADEPEKLQGATRQSTIHYRVRFAIVANP